MTDKTAVDMTKKEKRQFVAYEYKETETDQSMAELLQDGYENFGWEIVETEKIKSVKGEDTVRIRMKRDRRILNRTELTRLQRHFEACVDEIRALEKSKTTKATITALAVGLVGTVFMAGATFAATASEPLWGLMIVLAIPGFCGWALPYFLYENIRKKETKIKDEYIEAKYEELYGVCEKGSKLIAP